MILFSFRERVNDLQDQRAYTPRAWRWICEIGRGHAGFYHQWLPREGDWRHGGGYYDISITRHWSWGEGHTYYDGPHCSFSIGPIHLNWSGDWCDKCFGADEET